jgi:hypothetical protein
VEENEEELEEYVLESVLDHDEQNGIISYHTKWMGSEDLTWEGEQCFDAGADVTLALYWRGQYEALRVREQEEKKNKATENDRERKKRATIKIRKQCGKYFM